MKKVCVGMSGGVDSSAATALLISQGYEVSGVHLVLTENDEIASSDARKVAETLKIPFEVLNLKKDFEKEVIDYFSKDYQNGKTPNPCVVCNRKIKFGMLYDHVINSGNDFFATGHYAQIVSLNDRFALKKSESPKDQSYFLNQIQREKLEHILFPVDSLTKEQTREIATANNLPVANKSDSQEICFIPDNNYSKFLSDICNIKSIPGDFVNENGEVIGKHTGIINYTIGQRKGLGAFGVPMFVTSIDVKNNKILLAEAGNQNTTEFFVDGLNYISYDSFDENLTYMVKIRAAAKPVEAKVLYINDNTVRVKLNQPVRAVTPGQFAVFYYRDFLVAGGTIKFF